MQANSNERNEPLKGLEYLEGLPIWSGAKYDLEHPKSLLAAFDNPQDKIKTIHVGGTNGKGSVSSLVAAMLIADGKQVGQFVSPHLSSITERCLVNGRAVSPDEYNEVVKRVVDKAQSLEISPSFFVYTMVSTILLCVEKGLDYLVLEVGLGGKLDATNVIKKSEVSVITSVSYDHMHILGDTLEEIALDKSGIFRKDVPAFIGEVGESVMQVIRDVANEKGTQVQFYGKDFREEHEKSGVLRSNLSLAVQVAKQLGLSNAAIEKGLTAWRWPGRLESVQSRGLNFLLDGAHNPASIDYLISHLELLSKEQGYRKFVFLISMLERKQWKEMLLQLNEFRQRLIEKGVAVEWVLTSSSHPNSVHPESLFEELSEGLAVEDPVAALELVTQRGSSESLVVICGSLYLIGELRPLIVEGEFRTYAE